ncbi:MAG: hypothetical protein GWO24_20750 [Akkermansiaceae bacterium]|nr:hypothetical protein [Akkermansiaceae bacterium]
MKRLHAVFVAAPLCLFVDSCGSPDSGSEPRVIDSVSPYSSLSDRELTARYFARLVELQSLYEEMEAANKLRDYQTVHAKAGDGLEKARDARNLARHLDDSASRRERLKGIDRIVSDLEHLVRVTGS